MSNTHLIFKHQNSRAIKTRLKHRIIRIGVQVCFERSCAFSINMLHFASECKYASNVAERNAQCYIPSPTPSQNVPHHCVYVIDNSLMRKTSACFILSRSANTLQT